MIDSDVAFPEIGCCCILEGKIFALLKLENIAVSLLTIKFTISLHTHFHEIRVFCVHHLKKGVLDRRCK